MCPCLLLSICCHTKTSPSALRRKPAPVRGWGWWSQPRGTAGHSSWPLLGCRPLTAREFSWPPHPKRQVKRGGTRGGERPSVPAPAAQPTLCSSSFPTHSRARPGHSPADSTVHQRQPVGRRPPEPLAQRRSEKQAPGSGRSCQGRDTGHGGGSQSSRRQRAGPRALPPAEGVSAAPRVTWAGERWTQLLALPWASRMMVSSH